MIFATGAPQATVGCALADTTLASLDRAGAPVLVAHCEALTAIAMNQAAADLFGADFETVSRRLFQGAEPASRRLVVLARTLLPGASPRLERMRFYFGPASETLTFLCRRVAADGQTFLVMAVPGVRAGIQPAAPPVAANESAPEPDVAEVAPHAVAAPATTMPVGVAEEPGSAAKTRFVWRTDSAHRLIDVVPPFWTMLRSPVHVTGRNFVDILSEVGADTTGLAEALASGETFSGLPLNWPAGDGHVVNLEFGGMPVSDAQQRFAGFRGFALASAAVAAPAAASPQSAEASEAEPLVVPLVAPAPRLAEIALPPSAAAEESGQPAPAMAEPETSLPSPSPEPRHSVSNVVPLRPLAVARVSEVLPAPEASPMFAGQVESELAFVSAPPPALSPEERSAFDEIARTLAGAVPRMLDESPALAEEPAHEEPAHEEPAHEEPARTLVAEAPVPEDDALSRNLGAVVDLVPIGILVSRDSIPIFANRTLLDLTGFANVDALHDDGGLANLFGGADVDTLTDDALAVSVRTIEGETIPVDARIHAVAWDGLPATLVSLRSARDRTAANRAKSLERSLRDREAEARELHTILDTATDGVAILDGEANILTLNRSAEALFGCDAGEIAGRPFASLVSDESRAPLTDYLAALAGGGVASLLNDGREILCRGPREGLIPVFVTIGRLESEEAPKLFAVLRDLTAWKDAERGLDQARQDAERASAQKSEFLARISHEIRTPLNAIIGFAEVIMDERFGPIGNDRYRDYMKDIHRSGEHVMSLVNDLLDLSKIEAGKMDMTFTAVDANSCVSDCVSLMQPQASRARVIIRLSLSPNLPKIIADERAFKQIVLNILSNAVKYNETGGQVIVSTARTDAGHAVVRIRDTGLGMTDSDVQVALEPFGQIDTSRATTGTGLGLPLTKALVEANRANFTIKSRKGEGTLVEIAFPPSRVMAD